MVRTASLFSQLLSLFPRPEFQLAVRAHGGDSRAKGFTCWEQFVAMLFCHLAQAQSLREICGGLACCVGKLAHLGVGAAPKRSTLAYANEHRSWEIYRDVFEAFLGRCRGLARGRKRFRFKNKLYSLDSTVIDLCLSLFPWASFRRTKGAVKLHLLLDHDGYLPSFALVTEGRRHDVRVARGLSLPAGSVVAMDRGYNDYALFGRWCREGVFFVTRMKSNAAYRVAERRAVPERGGILADEVIELAGWKARRDCPLRLRRIVCAPPGAEPLVFLTNHLAFGATTIARIYKDRWQIELFFRALKQNLKVKTFVGTTPNALRIQIWTALIALLLLKYLQLRATLDWALSNLVAFLRWNLFTYRDLWTWIDDPYETPPLEPPPRARQLPLDWGAPGQQTAPASS